MKQFVFVLLTFWVILPVHAQTEKDTLYGFREHISPGIKKAGEIDASGRFIKKAAPGLNRYAVYLTTASKATIRPVQLWINGEAFAVTLDSLPHPPVAPTNIVAPDAKPRYLFPETKGTIYRLTLIPLTKPQKAGAGKSLVDHNAAVFYYKKNGTTHYEVLKKFTELDAVALQ